MADPGIRRRVKLVVLLELLQPIGRPRRRRPTWKQRKKNIVILLNIFLRLGGKTFLLCNWHSRVTSLFPKQISHYLEERGNTSNNKPLVSVLLSAGRPNPILSSGPDRPSYALVKSSRCIVCYCYHCDSGGLEGLLHGLDWSSALEAEEKHKILFLLPFLSAASKHTLRPFFLEL